MLVQVLDLPQVRQMDGGSVDGEGGRGGATLFDYLCRPIKQYLMISFYCQLCLHPDNHGCNAQAGRQL